MKKLCITLILLSLMSIPVAAQISESQNQIPEADIDMLRERSDEFMMHIFNDDFSAAFDFIRSVPTAIGDANISSLQESAQAQLSAIEEHYGAKIGYTFISTDSVLDFLARFRYAVRYEHHLIWWQIVYYRGIQDDEDAWLIDNISYDDDIELLIESND